MGVYAGFAADPDFARPAPGRVYYLHVVAYGLGNSVQRAAHLGGSPASGQHFPGRQPR